MWLGLQTVSSLERCPLFRVSFIGRFHCMPVTYAESLSSRRDPTDMIFTPPWGETAGFHPYWLFMICCSEVDIMAGTLGPQMSRSTKPTWQLEGRRWSGGGSCYCNRCVTTFLGKLCSKWMKKSRQQSVSTMRVSINCVQVLQILMTENNHPRFIAT